MSTSGDNERLLTANDAATRLGVSANTIRRWWKEGRLPYVDAEPGRRSYRRIREIDVRSEEARRPRGPGISDTRFHAAQSEVAYSSTLEAARALRVAATHAIAAAIQTAEGAARSAEAHLAALREIQVTLGAYDDALGQHMTPAYPARDIDPL
jgi:excisionase family DNA binding protein